ncbi:pantoate--beta-alanine ligase, partial [candidate division KSB1 bacterium]|nr:pantoate--beta-alanine ligase [candidate division KSB1 bacterium]
MIVFSDIYKIREHRWRDPALSWGLVPTMGYLHEGHLSLVRRARRENDRVGVSIFLNPIQFNNPQDLQTYPVDIERDLDLLQQEQVDLVWTPSPEIMYPEEFQTYVNVERVTQPLEGEKRPGHFQGVTTVVAKLFNVFQPHRAYFGQKDAQQLIAIKKMARDLNFNVEIVPCSIVREEDGLAMSSRNKNLSPAARKQAICLYGALNAAKQAVAAGETNANSLRKIMTDIIEGADRARIDYVSVSNSDTLQELDALTGQALLSLAVYFDDVRLIDNMIVN